MAKDTPWDDIEMLDHYENMGAARDGDYYQRFNPMLFREKPYLAKFVESSLVDLFREVGRPDMMIDIGCGTGFYYPVLSRMAASITGIDFSHQMLRNASRVLDYWNIDNVSLVRGDIREMPFPSGKADMVFSWDVLHHVTGPDGIGDVIREIHRVLRKGGMYIGLEPNILNPLMVYYCLVRPEEHGALILHSRYLKKEFSRVFRSVETRANNTIISFVNASNLSLVMGADRTFRRFPFSLLAFREVLIARK